MSKIKKERHIWFDTFITLLTIEVMSFFSFGIRSAALAAICVAVSAFSEMISLRIMGRKFTADDLSVTSDALIIALMMPVVMDYRIAAAACVFAVVVAKNIFGGRKNMIFSPSAAAFLFMLTSWKNQLLQYPQPHTSLDVFEKAGELVNSASHDFNMKGKVSITDLELFLGSFNGPSGAVSILLLLVAAVILIFRRDISCGAFVGVIGGTVFMSCIAPVTENIAESVKYSLCLNMVLFAAVYIVSDRRIAPSNDFYAFFYGLFIAVVSYIVIITSGTENAIVPVTILFTPVAMILRNLEEKIEQAKSEQAQTENTEDKEAVSNE